MKEFILLIFLAGGDHFEVTKFETIEACKQGGRTATVEMAKFDPKMHVVKTACVRTSNLRAVYGGVNVQK